MFYSAVCLLYPCFSDHSALFRLPHRCARLHNPAQRPAGYTTRPIMRNTFHLLALLVPAPLVLPCRSILSLLSLGDRAQALPFRWDFVRSGTSCLFGRSFPALTFYY